jgi:phospho-N-acetylmuramoyl-pentapeptide-transferase
MAELGDGEREAHFDLGRFVVRLDVSRLVVVGAQAGGIHAGAVLEGSWGEESVHVDDVEAAVALLRDELEPGDVVLVKASRSAGLEQGRRRAAGCRPPRRPRGRPPVRSVLVAAMTALIVSLLCTPAVVRLFRRRGYGQEIREDGPSSHATKRGTPTMGGAVIIGATLIGYTVAHLLVIGQPGRGPTASALLVLYLMTGLGSSASSTTSSRSASSARWAQRAAKFIGQFVIGVSFAVLALQFENDAGLTPASTNLSFIRDYEAIALGSVGFVVLRLLPGERLVQRRQPHRRLDGSAPAPRSWCSAPTSSSASGSSATRACCSPQLGQCYEARDPLDIALVAASAMGACFGFLWWNASPAKIFMGDTGSLAIGGAFAGMAIVTRTELLLVVLGGLFVIETLSVILQVGGFKLTRKRLFNMAPIHHHFELAGWVENTVIVRFWIISGLAVAFGLGTFYAEYLSQGPLR